VDHFLLVACCNRVHLASFLRYSPSNNGVLLKAELRPVYSNTTQLNSTSSWVELCRRSVYSDADATQLNSGLKARRRNSTQLNSTRRRVELSCVAINGPLGSLKFRLNVTRPVYLCTIYACWNLRTHDRSISLPLGLTPFTSKQRATVKAITVRSCVKIIQGHKNLYQSKTRMRLPISLLL